MKYRNILFAAAILALCLMLCACGAQSAAPAASPSAEPTADVTPEDSAEPSAEPEASPASSSAPAATLPDAVLKADPDAESEALKTAKSFKNKGLKELVAAIGEPVSETYVASCLGPGEDGELSYEGFKVYTYRDEKGETVLEIVAD